MSMEDRLSELLVDWDESRQQGEELSADTICEDCPELVPALRRQIAELKATDWMFEPDDDEDDDFLSWPDLQTALIDRDDTAEISTSLSFDEFVQCLTSSGLMTAEELAEFRDGLSPQPEDSTELARQLVRQQSLTPYQAAEVCQGKQDGLVYGDYVVLDKLGAGGMGQVFKVYHRRMKRVVALKILRPDAASSAQAVVRFQREGEAAARLTHPNIVTAYDAREDLGVHYLVLEYVDGTDLSSLVKRNGPLPVAAAVDCIIQAARGLEYAHGEGVVHRDIKPGNLLLDTSGAVKVLDMGLARLEKLEHDNTSVQTEAEITRDDSALGTVDYMAPEQARDTKHADARADIYSLGCTLHYLLTGRPVYGGSTLMARMMAHQQQDMPALDQARSDVPDELSAVFRKMLAKRLEDRYQCVADLLEDLEAVALQVADPDVVPYLAPGVGVPHIDLRSKETSSTTNDATFDLPPMPQPAEAKPTRKPAPATARSRTFFLGGAAILALLLGGGIYLATIILRVETPEGTVILEIGESEKSVEVSVSEDKEITITDPNDGQKIRITVERGKQELTLHKNGFATQTTRFNLTSKDGRRVCVTFVPKRKPRTTAELLAKLSAEEQAAFAELCPFPRYIPLVDRSPAKPALVGHFHNERRIRRHLQHLKVLTNMHYLDLRNCHMSDTDLEHLADLDELRYLLLSTNPVTDAGLEHLKRLTNLQILRLENTQVSAAGVMELQKALPECLIEWPSRVRREPPSSAKMTADENAAIAELCLLGGDIVPVDRGAARPALLCSFYGKRSLANHLQPLSVLTNMCLLDLENCDVADADLKHLATLNGLHCLRLRGNKVTDAGLKHLACLSELRFLHLNERQVTDAGLEHLRGLDKLQYLMLNRTAVDGTGLVHLKGLGALGVLKLARTRVNDASLEHLSGLTNLQELSLTTTRVSDAGLKHLSGLANLQNLGLGHTQVTDAGVKHLGGLTNLQGLGLYDTQVTDAGLKHLGGLTNLQFLWLNDTQVTDAGLEHLTGLTNLQELRLDSTGVTDAGLVHLRGLTNLQNLTLENTRVTVAGLTDLRKALPDCQIRWPSYDVPEGGVDELLQFIENLKQFRPATPQERAEYQSKAQAALKLAAQRILAQDKDPWSKPCQTALRALLEIRITDIPQADRQQQGQTVEFVKTFLKGKLERQLESLDVDLARSAAQALETCRNLELAAQAYDQFADLIAESGNKEFSKTVKDMKDAAKRLSNAER